MSKTSRLRPQPSTSQSVRHFALQSVPSATSETNFRHFQQHNYPTNLRPFTSSWEIIKSDVCDGEPRRPRAALVWDNRKSACSILSPVPVRIKSNHTCTTNRQQKQKQQQQQKQPSATKSPPSPPPSPRGLCTWTKKQPRPHNLCVSVSLVQQIQISNEQNNNNINKTISQQLKN